MSAAMDMMKIFGLIVIALGLYAVYSGIMMRKTKIPGKWLMGELEMDKCDDEKGFAMAMSGKTLFFGIAVILYGIICTLNKWIWENKTIDIISVIFFVAVCVYFIVVLNSTKRKYFRQK